MSQSGNSLKEVAPKLATGIRLATAVESKDINFYNSIDQDVKTKSTEVNAKILNLLDKLVSSVSTIVPDSEYDKERILTSSDSDEKEKWKAISSTLESLYENTEVSLEEFARFKRTGKPQTTKTESKDDEFTYLDESDRDNANNNNNRRIPQSYKISKPQLKFINPVDPTIENQPFKPLITTKPNALKSFQESMVMVPANEDNSIPQHYENPYAYEIMNQEYPEWLVDPHRDTSKDFQSIPWKDSKDPIFVERPDQLPSLLEDMSKSKVIAVDLEHHDYRTYHGLTCLMQITTESHTDYLIDTLSPSLLPHLSQLNIIFTDPNIIKVFHGASSDIIWLQRDLGLYIVSLFDTYHASKELNLGKYSLAFLLEKYVRFKTSKKWQLADWRVRPLPQEMKDYAKADTHFLIEVFYKMQREILKYPGKMPMVLRNSRKVSNRRFEYSTFRPINQSAEVSYTSGSVPQSDEILNNNVSLDNSISNSVYPWTQLATSNGISQIKIPLLEALFKWRDTKARSEDESIRYIMSDFLLTSLVNKFDVTMNDTIDETQVSDIINSVSRFGNSLYVKNSVKELTILIRDCLTIIKNSDAELWDKTEKAFANSSDIYNSVVDVNGLENNFNLLTDLYKQTYINSDEPSTNIVTIDSNSSRSEPIYGIEYDSGMVSTYDIIMKRKDYAVKQFEKKLEEIPMAIPSADEEEDEEEKDSEERESSTSLSANDKKKSENPDEIIALRKHNRNQKKNKKEGKSEFSDDIQYLDLNSKKIVTEHKPEKFNKKSKQQQSKKRSFDPYAGLEDEKKSGIPQMKKKKLQTYGKNLTFTKRR